jgi:hypothetical protein
MQEHNIVHFNVNIIALLSQRHCAIELYLTLQLSVSNNLYPQDAHIMRIGLYLSVRAVSLI